MEANPFSITLLEEAGESSDKVYQVMAKFDLPELQPYKDLLEKYNKAEFPYFDGNLVESVALIIKERASQLLDYLDFDEEGDWLDIHAEGADTVRSFIQLICPVYQDLELLEQYMMRASGSGNR